MSGDGKSGSRSLVPKILLSLMPTLVPISIAARIPAFASLLDAQRAPEDNVPWNRVFVKIQSEIGEQGSELAA
ncbi:MAG: hypothetical protein C4K48_09470 [Candidatus Thorarchaeota archaeon]|nr:MAG: hypothetical protein C4K48_09470 [Candidatus Thorarchaeota archaeon]